MAVFLMRHSETVGNAEKLIIGRMDTPLTDKGKKTAERLAELIARERPGMIVASPLGRARVTAEIIAQASEVPLTLSDHLMELSCGAWEGFSFEEMLPQGGLLRPGWQDSPPGGESYADGERRLAPFIEQVRGLAQEGHVVLVGHACINRSFLKLWLGLTPSEALSVYLPHETVHVIGNAGDVIWIDTEGRQGEGLRRSP